MHRVMVVIFIFTSMNSYAVESDKKVLQANFELNQNYLKSLESRISRYPNTTSILIRSKNRLSYEKYFGKGSADLLNDTRSSTKSLTAVMLGFLVAEKELSVFDSAFSYLQHLAPFENDSPLKRQISIRDLLTMTSALDCNDNKDTPGNEENMYPKKNWSEWASNIPVKTEYRKNMHGYGGFSYCTAGSMLLGQVIAKVSGENLDKYFSEKLFKPLGIEKWQWTRSPSGEYMTGGGLRLNSRALSKIGQMLLNSGRWQGRQVIPAQWSREVLRPRVRANQQQEYGYQFWSRVWRGQCGSVKASYMAGNGGNAIVVIPELETVIVVTRTHFGQREMHQQTIQIIEDYLLDSILCKA